jgi:hypothetical protein
VDADPMAESVVAVLGEQIRVRAVLHLAQSVEGVEDICVVLAVIGHVAVRVVGERVVVRPVAVGVSRR